MSIESEKIGVQLNVDACSPEASISLDITASKPKINFPIAAISAGHDEDIPVPGLSVGIKGIDAGIVIDVSIGGNADALSLKVGVDACAQVPIIGKECGSSITSYLPIELLDETYNFGSMCKSRKSALRGSEIVVA